MIYEQISPDTYTNTCWFDVVKNKKIIQFLRFETIKVEGRKGGPIVYLLKECYKNGIYHVIAEITSEYSKRKNRHTLLYNGDFGKEKDSKSKGAGYIDFKTDKVFGRWRSCLQDTMANIGLLFGHDLKDMIYEQILPDTYTDTYWFDVVRNKKIIQFLRFETIKVEGRRGGPTV